MQEITDRADVGAGTVYNYFDSKQDLLGSIVSEELANLVVVVRSAASAIGDRRRAAAGAYWLTLERLATDVIWGHLLHQPEILGDTIYQAHKMAGETDLFAARSRYLDSAHTGKFAIELAWWQTVGTLVALAQAVRDGYLFCDEAFLREATGNMLRMNGVPEHEIRELLAEAPTISAK
jgi:AcrR family transcriptional regulator